MKNWIKENGIKILLIGVFVFAIFFYKGQTGQINNPYQNLLTSNDPLSSELIVCQFDTTASFSREGNDQDVSESKIEYSIDKQSEPVVLTFANLSSSPIMKGNGGEVPLTIVKNTDELMLLAEQSFFGDTFFYTIFKKEKTAVWQKAYLLVDTPFALVSMGYCN